jgi:hypothetical protein
VREASRFEVVAMARAVGLLAAPDVQRLAQDVETCVRVATDRLMRAAKRNGGLDDLMSSSFRDKKQIEWSEDSRVSRR